jgi:hypothetical protein
MPVRLAGICGLLDFATVNGEPWYAELSADKIAVLQLR